MSIRHLMAVTALGAWVSVAGATTITQSFSTGTLIPGSDTQSAFTVNKFNTTLGTLTAVTMTITLDSWGGSYQVENATANPEAEVSGSAAYGASGSITGSRVPDSVSAAIHAQVSGSYDLLHAGDTYTLNGPAYEARNHVSGSGSADSADFGLYEGSGTYLVTYHSSQYYYISDVGGVKQTIYPNSAAGTLTVTYEYTPVPEPASMALLGIGGLMVGLRRRLGKKA